MAIKMTREEAIKIVQSATVWTDEERDALAMLIPELAESEDERMLREIKRYIKEQGDKPTGLPNGTVAISDMIAWLEKQKEQNLIMANSPQLKEQKPAEWSEKDEKDMAHIIRILDDCYVYGTHDLSKTDHENLVNKLKSLRPSWKPSEEHLSALLAVFNDPNNIGSQTCQLALTDLYEQLKKL